MYLGNGPTLIGLYAPQHFSLTREIYLPGHDTSVFESVNKNSVADGHDFDGCVGTCLYGWGLRETLVEWSRLFENSKLGKEEELLGGQLS
jgi:hypothetical protein